MIMLEVLSKIFAVVGIIFAVLGLVSRYGTEGRTADSIWTMIFAFLSFSSVLLAIVFLIIKRFV